jgi:Bacterial regulatory proteins, lacI family
MTAKRNLPDADRPATLKMLAEYLDLLPATESIVLNNSPVATSIPAATKQRIHAAAERFNYRPNLHAACCALVSPTPSASSLPNSASATSPKSWSA